MAVICQLSLTGSAGASTAASLAANKANTASAGVKPNKLGEMDCNGWSKAYRTVRAMAGMNCTDPIKVVNGKATRFIDNGWYVGHDEPTIKFISNTPGSAESMSYLAKLPVDPAAAPTASGSVTNYGELSVAPWFGLGLCDPRSYPQNPCTPGSDSNVGLNEPNAAGGAFMELQLYPPGYTPFVDAEGCSKTKWCAALNIDSLECNFNFFYCNPNCTEPINFAFLETNGVPAGPPSPQLATVQSYLADSHTLLMNQGDVIQVSITDPAAGITATIHDLTTHQTGWITASAKNGFMNSDLNTCNGFPYTYHAEYNTASIDNRTPWAALEGGVLMEQEIGHSEVCSSLANNDPYLAGFPDGSTYEDDNVYDTCQGGSDSAYDSSGEGPCQVTSFTGAGTINTEYCENATTQGNYGPTGCPNDDPTSGSHCEYADGYCLPQGARTALVNGNPVTEWSDTNECFDNRFQNGDLDYDGVDYQTGTWPNGSPNHPTSFQYVGPFMANGQPYPSIQFETDASGSERLCAQNGQGCVVPPISAEFYPYWSIASSNSALGSKLTSCVWNFGASQPNTINSFGGDKQYGGPDLSWFFGTNISQVLPNPQFSGACTGASYA